MKTEFEKIVLETTLQSNISAVTPDQLTSYIQSSNTGGYKKILKILKESKDSPSHKEKLKDAAFDAHWEWLLKQ